MKQLSNKTIKQSKGFTIIELLVSVSIIAIIAGIFFMNYRKTSKKASVRMTAQKIASEIRMVQNYAMSLKMAPVSGVIPERWGIFFTKGIGNVLVFADAPESGSNKAKKYRPGDELFDTITLPAGITVYDNRIDGDITGDNKDDYLYITTEPPDPYTFICGANNSGGAVLQLLDKGYVDIDLIYETDLTTLTTIRINKFGLVDVN